MKKIFATFIAMSALLTFAQQDKHFSMFFANQVQFNPAAAGHFGGDIRLFTNFRTQWFTIPGRSFRSISASVDGRLFEDDLNNGFIGIGANFYNDVSGDGGYTMNVISVPLNYSLKLNHTTHLALGVQPGVYMTSVQDGLYFKNQWTGTEFNTDIPTGEPLEAFSQSQFDLSAGVHFVAAPSSHKKFEFGFSGFHLLKQDVSLYGINENLYRNFTFFGKADLGNSFNDWSFHPAIIAMAQGPNWNIVGGCNFQYILKPASKHTMYFDGQSISFGVYHRVMDSFIGNIIYNAGRFSIGASYDMNISGLIPATKTVGAAEIFLSFSPDLGGGRFGAPRIH